MTEPKFKAQHKYIERQKSRGRVRVTCWVPPENRREILDIAAEMCQEADEAKASKHKKAG